MSDKKFIDAYDDLMANLYEIMDDTLHSVADGLELAKQKTMQGLNQEEIDQIAHFLMRDLEDAANSSPENENSSLSEWLKFDIELIENFALEAFSSIADKTRIELARIEHQAKKYHPYQSGDITGAGTLICDSCGKIISFKSTSEIPNCPACNGKTYSRS